MISLLRSLSPVQRTVAAMFYDGLTCGEIANLTGRPEATVRSQLRLARKTLKEVIVSAGHLICPARRLFSGSGPRAVGPEFSSGGSSRFGGHRPHGGRGGAAGADGSFGRPSRDCRAQCHAPHP